MKTIVASRCPYRPRSRAAFRSSSTSFGVRYRYSRGRRAELSCRGGGTVPFSSWHRSRRAGFAWETRELAFMTVPFMTLFGTVQLYHNRGGDPPRYWAPPDFACPAGQLRAAKILIC